VPNVEVIDEIVWDSLPVLHPGMDFHDGVTYFTTPLKKNVVVPPKKKGEDATIKKEWRMMAVTSERDAVWYEEDNLEAHGFSPSEQVYQETEPRWSPESTRAYLHNKVNAPTTEQMFNRLRSIYTTYVEFADETYHDIMALFVMYTYVFRLFESTGYIHFNGTAASGKSRNLSMLNALAFNTVWASSMSAASLYRKLAGSPGTTCIDETEGFEGERGEELRRILNAGYKDGAKVTRTEKGPNERWMPVQYDVFGPKALASINTLDNVIGSRCLIVAMRPAIRELPDFLTHDPEWGKVRDQLYLWALENAEVIDALKTEWYETKKTRLCPKLIGRQWETTAQYIILADYVGGEALATKVIAFLNAYFAKQQEALDATDRQRTTLRCLPRVLATCTPHDDYFYSVKDIHEVVSSYMETDATEYFKTKHVTKNLDTIGFKNKVRASGGLRIQLVEEAVRNEFRQRRVEPFEEDAEWLTGKRTYQHATTLFEPGKGPLSQSWWDGMEDTDGDS
jgi:hypothetical protein